MRPSPVITVVVGLLLLDGTLGSYAWGASHPETRTSVMVLSLEPRGGNVTRDTCELLTAAITNEASRYPVYQVVSMKEAEGTFSQEQIRALRGCDAISCAAELAGSLGVSEVVIGNLGTIGDASVLTLTRIRSRDAAVMGRTMQRVPMGKEAEFLDRLPTAVAELFGQPAANASRAEQPPTLPKQNRQSASDSSKATAEQTPPVAKSVETAPKDTPAAPAAPEAAGRVNEKRGGQRDVVTSPAVEGPESKRFPTMPLRAVGSAAFALPLPFVVLAALGLIGVPGGAAILGYSTFQYRTTESAKEGITKSDAQRHNMMTALGLAWTGGAAVFSATSVLVVVLSAVVALAVGIPLWVLSRF